MAETITQINQPPEFIEAAGKTYLTDLQKAIGQYKGADLSKVMGSQFVAGMDPLQLAAQRLAIQGIGAYKPFLQAAQASTGPNAYKQFMSPYQQDVINTTLSEYDVQAQKSAQGVPAAAIAAGAFGGGREGVQRAEYRSTSDRNRAGLQAQLLQQGFGQANQLAQQNYLNQLNLGQAQQGFMGQDIGAMQTFGGINQAQKQQQLSAQQQLLQAQLNQPLTAAQQYGSGIASLISGYPGGTQQTTQPYSGPSNLQTGISAGATLAGLYRAFNAPTV
tara:strand:- start:1223 stop:2047 length:825 start_codon:yes stop_codon:yes gene_type:complete